ncbi:SDR family NAD(P)-dependent oxidoreductase [Streptomyces sp. NRRL S-87]|uniref:SDR family NAD(P)-dependent oxidoreductase n=1 Tax=Streptomyces sp. NRRL S-87 TaxID=1463920 RepID=UPI0004C1AD37|nr:SDR family NAD(P)-dependent oxidoreductase [Streptomyces sp. NRRL S-87]
MTTTAPSTAAAAAAAAAAPATGGSRTWFVTGASRGLGRAFAEAALAAGDRVAAVARTTAALDELAAAHPGRVLPLTADVTDRAAAFAAVAAAAEHFGRLDVVVNNAGTLSAGMVEEFTEAEARAQMDVNFFGALWVSQAAMPVLRARGGGHVVQISSIGGLAGFPSTGLYSASKFALEGMSEALAMEGAAFGVKVSIVQPGGYWTDLYTSMRTTTPLAAYAPLRAELERQWAEGSVDSEPRLAAEALLALVDAEEPPLRLLLGSTAYDLAFDVAERRRATWAGWERVSRAAEKAVPPPA